MPVLLCHNMNRLLPSDQLSQHFPVGSVFHNYCTRKDGYSVCYDPHKQDIQRLIPTNRTILPRFDKSNAKRSVQTQCVFLQFAATVCNISVSKWFGNGAKGRTRHISPTTKSPAFRRLATRLQTYCRFLAGMQRRSLGPRIRTPWHQLR